MIWRLTRPGPSPRSWAGPAGPAKRWESETLILAVCDSRFALDLALLSPAMGSGSAAGAVVFTWILALWGGSAYIRENKLISPAPGLQFEARPSLYWSPLELSSSEGDGDRIASSSVEGGPPCGRAPNETSEKTEGTSLSSQGRYIFAAVGGPPPFRGY